MKHLNCFFYDSDIKFLFSLKQSLQEVVVIRSKRQKEKGAQTEADALHIH